jgi:putative membrane protein (TIGR04086 family)
LRGFRQTPCDFFPRHKQGHPGIKSNKSPDKEAAYMNSSKTGALIRSLLISYVISGLLLLALSFALYRLKLKEAQINQAVFAVYGIACLASGFVCGKITGKRRFFWGLFSGLLYFAVLFLLSWAVSRGASPASGRTAAVMLLCAAAGAIGGILS